MAHELSHFPKHEKFPSEWFALEDGYGPIIQLVSGDDYTCKYESIRQQLYNHAYELGIKIKINRVMDEDERGKEVETAVFQAYHPDVPKPTPE